MLTIFSLLPPNTIGSSTSGSFSAFWNGDKNGFVNERLDGLFLKRSKEEPEPEPCTNDSFDGETKLTAFDGEANDYFGQSVAISGSTMVVGAKGDDYLGSAYIYERNACGEWLLIKKILPSDRGTFGSYDRFGSHVAISGDTVTVARYDRDKVYIYSRNQGGENNWGEVKKLTSSLNVASIAISGDTIVVGDQLNRSAYIHERNEGGSNNWGKTKEIVASYGEPYQYFGHSVAISEDANTIIVGVNDMLQGEYTSGSGYIYERDVGGNNNWGEVGRLPSSYVAISQDTIVVARPYYDATDDDLGFARPLSIYKRSNSTWEKVREISSSNNIDSSFGLYINISGDTIVAGPVLIEPSFPYVFFVSVFERNSGGNNTWGEVEQLQIDGLGDGFPDGMPIGISEDNTIVVGAGRNDDKGKNAGLVYVVSVNFLSSFTLTTY